MQPAHDVAVGSDTFPFGIFHAACVQNAGLDARLGLLLGFLIAAIGGPSWSWKNRRRFFLFPSLARVARCDLLALRKDFR